MTLDGMMTAGRVEAEQPRVITKHDLGRDSVLSEILGELRAIRRMLSGSKRVPLTTAQLSEMAADTYAQFQELTRQ